MVCTNGMIVYVASFQVHNCMRLTDRKTCTKTEVYTIPLHTNLIWVGWPSGVHEMISGRHYSKHLTMFGHWLPWHGLALCPQPAWHLPPLYPRHRTKQSWAVLGRTLWISSLSSYKEIYAYDMNSTLQRSFKCKPNLIPKSHKYLRNSSC